MKDLHLTYRTWAEVNLDAIAYNIMEIKKYIGDKVKLMAVVKADAYGHGYLEVSKTMLESGADALGVAFIDEAEQLRRSRVDAPILILGFTPGKDLERVVDSDVTATIYSFEQAKILSDYALKVNKKAKVHIKIDTGMNRLGILFNDKDAVKAVCNIYNLQGILVEGIFSHLAMADEDNEEYSLYQYNNFCSFIKELEKKGVNIPVKHICNSAGTIKFPFMHMDMVRTGIINYGCYPSNDFNTKKINLKSAMSLKTVVTRIAGLEKGGRVSYGGIFTAEKPMKIATIPIGYADGYSRALTGKAKVIAGEKIVNVIGRICMDQCIIDVTDVNNINMEDTVTIMGRDGDRLEISAEQVAEEMGTISYEILCLIGKRVPRVYYKGEKIIDVLNYLE